MHLTIPWSKKKKKKLKKWKGTTAMPVPQVSNNRYTFPSTGTTVKRMSKWLLWFPEACFQYRALLIGSSQWGACPPLLQEWFYLVSANRSTRHRELTDRHMLAELVAKYSSPLLCHTLWGPGPKKDHLMKEMSLSYFTMRVNWSPLMEIFPN